VKIFSLANIITLLNLFFGCIAVLLLVENNIEIQYVFVLTFICLILDFFDGLIARYYNMQSDIGIQLDSLADMISFGLVPGIIIYNLFIQAPSSYVGSILSSVIPFFSFLVTISSAIRLAKFNISKSNSSFFNGLPTPANTILIYSIAIIISDNNKFADLFLSYSSLIFLVLISSFLLICNLKLLNFKFKKFKIKGNRRRIFILLTSAILVYMLSFYSIPIIMIIYIVVSIFTFYGKTSK
tara:strand:+ start:1929 stop:2648 length:720 start_codon:yes stop_codon:yes gene_type:complete